MNHYKIILAYDGTDFQGWQVQPHKLTIANRLEESFYQTFGEHVSINGASRTDAGVHALGQVAVFSCEQSHDPDILKTAWNNVLPDSLLIRSVEKVSTPFNPYLNVKEKTYYYNLFLTKPLPFVARYGWRFPYIKHVDFDTFAQTLSLYEGTHDFRSFCKLEDEQSTIRTVSYIGVREIKRYGMVQVVIKGKGFLHFQIRRMIGYALDVARRPDLTIDYVRDLLAQPSAEQTLVRADAKGLILRKIQYDT